MEIINRIAKLSELKKRFQEDLEKLHKMRGVAKDGKKVIPKCHTIEFKTEYGAHTGIRAAHDSELTHLLVNTAIKHLERRISEIDEMFWVIEDRLGDVNLVEKDADEDVQE